MTKPIFEPVVSVFLKGDKRIHGVENIQYKVSYGYENGNTNVVFKVQMSDGTKVKGRQAPSYTDKDFEAVCNVRRLLRKKFDSLDNRLRNVIFYYDDASNSLSEVN